MHVKQALIGLFSSKKAIIAVTTAIVAVTAELGYDVSETKLGMILGFGGVLIAAFGLADHGKERAKIESEKP